MDLGMKELGFLKNVLDGTMNAIISRYDQRGGYGWIDLKFDAIDGADHFYDRDGIRGRNHVYTWIQGRGLEAICSHISWYGLFSGFDVPDLRKLRAIADSVAGNLYSALAKHGGHLPFDILPDGTSSYESNGMWTMSDLFCSRGLYAHSALFGDEGQKHFSREYLDGTVRAILGGRFYNDQLSFDSSQYRAYSDGRTSYAGQMLALGAVVLEMKLEKDPEAPKQGRRLVDYVLGRHCNLDGRWKSIPRNTIVEWVDSRGMPARDEDGRMRLDPGHALEFVGLSCQMVDVWQRRYDLDADDQAWAQRFKSLAAPILKANFRHGWRAPGGVAKNVDAETGEVLVPSMPWWAVPETMRALILSQSLAGDEAYSKWARRKFGTCLRAFEKRYYRASPSPIAVQTIGPDGKPEAVIPATPDLDPGYHTGLSFMASYDAIARTLPLFLQKSEIEITPARACLLSGHIARNKRFESVLDPIRARVLVLRSAYSQLAWLSLDLLELDRDWVSAIQAELSPILGIPGRSIVICSTHTHTAPAVISLGTLKANKTYLGQAKARIAKAARKAASEEPVPVEAFGAVGKTGFGVNRRYLDPRTKRISMRPNPKGDNDASLPILAFKDPSGKIQAVVFNCSVHPTTLGVGISAVSADYPGRIAACLRKKYSDDLLAFPVTGACGDVRPALLDESGISFRDGTDEDVQRIGEAVAGHIQSLVAGARKLGTVRSAVFSLDVDLGLRDIPTRAHLESCLRNNSRTLKEAKKMEAALSPFAKAHDNPVWDARAERSWALDLLARRSIPDSVKETVHLVNICSVMVYCIPGELFSGVGLKIKAINSEREGMIAGYCGGSVGYLPSAAAVEQGGYEVDGAYKYYYLPGPFDKGIEKTMISSMEELSKESGLYDKKAELHI